MEKAITKNTSWDRNRGIKIGGILLPILLVAVQWITYERLTDELIYDVPKTLDVPAFETNWLYLFLHLFAVIPVFALSFDKRVHYHTHWKRLFPAVAIVAALFIMWDVIFTEMNVWNFNEKYFLGVRFLSLPIEEWLFFFTIPFASIFIYECLNYYVPKDYLATSEKGITVFLIATLVIGGFVFWNKIYTSTTFLLTAAFLLYHLLFLPAKQRSRFYLAFLVILIPFTLVDGVLTGGYTIAPIVLYNPLEFLDFRIFSVPLEDYIYGFLMLLGMISLKERQKKA
ncbi:MAG: lycopene cyclase domain-containing protein [Bacteroidota bacterium]